MQLQIDTHSYIIHNQLFYYCITSPAMNNTIKQITGPFDLTITLQVVTPQSTQSCYCDSLTDRLNK